MQDFTGQSQQEQLYNSQQGSKQIKGVEGYRNEMNKSQGLRPPPSSGALSQMIDRIEKENAAKEEVIQLLTDVFHRMTGDHPQLPDPIPENDRERLSILMRLDESINMMGRKNSKLYTIVDQLSKLV